MVEFTMVEFFGLMLCMVGLGIMLGDWKELTKGGEEWDE